MTTRALGRKSTASDSNTWVPLNRKVAGYDLSADITAAMLRTAMSIVDPVQSDWNASSGLAMILNKPDLGVYQLKSNMDSVLDDTDAAGTNATHYGSSAAIISYVQAYVGGMIVAGQQWKPSVTTYQDLPVISGSEQNTTWLCRVTSENDVYQRVAGTSSQWLLFSEDGDFVTPTELGTAISTHNGSASAHSALFALYSKLDGTTPYTGHPGVPTTAGDLTASTDATHYATRKQIADTVALYLKLSGGIMTGALTAYNENSPTVGKVRNIRIIAASATIPADLGENEILLRYNANGVVGSIYTRIGGVLTEVLGGAGGAVLLSTVVNATTGAITITTSVAPTSQNVYALLGGAAIAGAWTGTGTTTLTFTPTTAAEILDAGWEVRIA